MVFIDNYKIQKNTHPTSLYPDLVNILLCFPSMSFQKAVLQIEFPLGGERVTYNTISEARQNQCNFLSFLLLIGYGTSGL